MKKNDNTRHSFNTRKRGNLRRKLLPLLIAGCFDPHAAWANPVDPQIVNGQVSISNQGKLLSITNSPGAIINWKDFSINAGETTRFIQQNASSSVLNRITGQNPSQILGALQSNGRVFLINPNGILFGQGSQVNVNGLVVSTLNLKNEDFLAGKLNFNATDKAGNIQNQGAITTPEHGQVYLIAPNVENSGIITSPKGEVLLAAGHSVQLVDSRNPDLHVVVSAPEDTAINLGQIIAQSGQTGIYGALIKQRGIVNANSAVVGENGKIVFKASKDTILDDGSLTTATGVGKGGDIHILGDRVGLAGSATVDASGQTGGGTVLIGGDYHGENPNIQNAKRTYIDPHALIKADAIQSGDGGKAIVWSDEITRVYGTISARGGATSGSGGFVETSGKQSLDYHAKVDVSAPAGKGGTLLLDPAAITLVGGTGDGASTPDGTGIFKGSSTPGTVNFADKDLTQQGVSKIFQSELEGMTPGTNIVLEATDYINAAGTFSNLVKLPMNANLTMRTRNASTDGTALTGINLVGSSDSSNLEFKTQGTGTITLQTGTGSSPQAANIYAGKLTTEGGQVTVNASGSIVLQAISTKPPTSGTGGNISISSSGSDATIGTPSNGLIDSGGGTVTLQADKMSLFGKINAGNSIVSLTPLASTAIHVGTPYTIDATPGTLELSGAELNNISANTLRIGNANSGAIDIQSALNSAPGGALEHISTALNLTSANTITQQANATIDGISGVTVKGSSVTLTEANSTGVISGGSTKGDFQYRSSNQLTISTVDGVGGLTIPSIANIKLISDSAQGINQTLGNVINANGGGLILQTPGPVILTNAGNTIGKLAADLNPGNAGAGSLTLYNSTDMNVTGPLLGVSGITTNNQDVQLATDAGKTLTISQPINAGTARGLLQADTLALNNSVTAAIVGIHPTTAGRTITIGSNTCSSAPCLNVTNLYQIAAPTIGIGTDTAGDMYVAGITNSNSNTVTDIKNGVTTRIGLLSGGNITQGGPITVQDLLVGAVGTVDLNLNNTVTHFAGITGNNLNFVNTTGLNVTTMSGENYSLSGVSTSNGNVSLTTNTGDISLAAPINAGTGSVTLTANGGAISQSSGSITGSSLSATASNGIGTNSAPLITQVGSLTATNSGANTDITIKNAGALTVQDVTQSASGSLGGIAIANKGGALTIASGKTVSTYGGDIHLKTDNSLIVDGSVLSVSGGNITLEAGITDSSTALSDTSTSRFKSIKTTLPTDNNIGNISLAAPINAGTGSVTLTANGGSISQSSGSITGSSLTATASNGIGQGTALATQIGSLTATNSGANTDINIKNTGALTVQDVMQSASGGNGNISIENSSGILNVASGKTVSTYAGNIHLKSASALTVDGSVLSSSAGAITLEAGVTGSTNDKLTINGAIAPNNAAGIAVASTGNILLKAGDAITIGGSVNGNVTQHSHLNAPPLNQCIATPSLSGCDSVLPTLSQCTATPTLAGCSVVLPTLSQCTSIPTLPGCSVVLPLQAQTNEPTSPVTQALNSNVAAINSTTSSVAQLTSTTTGTADNGKASDPKKDAKKDTTGTNDTGAKKDDVAKKMYCN